jgi:thioredoxin 1
MATTALDASTFDGFVSAHDVAVVGFVGGAAEDAAAYAAAASAAQAAHPDVAFATVGADQPEVLAMFAVDSSATAIFRERIVLFLDLGILPAARLTELLRGAKALDMAKVHARVEAEKAAEAAEAALATHRVCPTARRGKFS